jgi:hypothetical protein
MRWLIWLSVILSISGCFYGGPTVKAVVAESVKIPPPAPLAKGIDMLIVEGDLIRCDAGCEKLLREYDGVRGAILKAWPP